MFKKMKTINLIIILTILAFISVVAPWVFTFYGDLSTSSNDWASFGSYIGGTLSPIISLMALIGLLHTINQQQKQINNLSTQATKEDLFKIIVKIEDDFFKNLNQYPIILNTENKSHSYSAESVLLDLSFLKSNEVIFNEDDFKKHMHKNGNVQLDDPAILSLGMFATATGQLNQLRLLVTQYDSIANDNILTLYYKRKYKTAYSRLHSKGLIKEPWN